MPSSKMTEADTQKIRQEAHEEFREAASQHFRSKCSYGAGAPWCGCVACQSAAELQKVLLPSEDL